MIFVSCLGGGGASESGFAGGGLRLGGCRASEIFVGGASACRTSQCIVDVEGAVCR